MAININFGFSSWPPDRGDGLPPFFVTERHEPSAEPPPRQRLKAARTASEPVVKTDDADDTSAMPPRPALAESHHPMFITQTAYGDIMKHLVVSRFEQELGGMLLGPKGQELITHYVPDENGKATRTTFTLDAPGLNGILRDFLKCRMDAKGLVHLHPPGVTAPSRGDLDYVSRAFGQVGNADTQVFHLPIVCDGVLYPYMVRSAKPGEVLCGTLVLV